MYHKSQLTKQVYEFLKNYEVYDENYNCRPPTEHEYALLEDALNGFVADHLTNTEVETPDKNIEPPGLRYVHENYIPLSEHMTRALVRTLLVFGAAVLFSLTLTSVVYLVKVV